MTCVTLAEGSVMPLHEELPPPPHCEQALHLHVRAVVNEVNPLADENVIRGKVSRDAPEPFDRDGAQAVEGNRGDSCVSGVRFETIVCQSHRR